MLLLFILIQSTFSSVDTKPQSFTFINNQKTQITLHNPNQYLEQKSDFSFNFFRKKQKLNINSNEKQFYYIHYSNEDSEKIQQIINFEPKNKMLKNTYLAYITNEQLQQISDISLVKRLDPEDKLINFGGKIEDTDFLLITTAEGNEIPENSELYTVESRWFQDTYVVRIDGNKEQKKKAVEVLCSIPYIERVSTYKKPVVANNVGVGYTQRNSRNFVPGPNTTILSIDKYMNDHHITGKGEIITVIDTLIDFHHSMFYDKSVPVEFNKRLENHRKIEYYGYHFSMDNWTGTIQENEHGTHVSGTAAGNNADCPSSEVALGFNIFDGNAPDAKILYAGQLNNVSAEEQLELMYELNSKISTNSWGVDGFNDEINYIYSEVSLLDPSSIFIFAAGNSYEKYGNYSINDPGGAKNVLTVGALDSFYERVHIYYLRSVSNPSTSLFAYSLVDPEPYMMGTIGTKEVGSRFVVINGSASGNNCQTIDVPQISIIYAQSELDLLWLFGCDIRKSEGILYTYDLKNLDKMLKEKDNMVYLQDATPFNKSFEPRHAPYSSTGPANKGILKPDLMAPGTRIISAKSLNHSDRFHGCEITIGDSVIFMQGTSMATPNVAGAAALVRQYFRTNWTNQPVDLTGPTVRALLINSCIQQPVGTKTPNIIFGHGQIDLSTVLPVENNFGVQITHQTPNEQPSITEFSQRVAKLNVKSNSRKVQITMSYLDTLTSPTSYIPLTRDLDLVVVSKSGRFFTGDHLPHNATQHFSTNEKVIINEDEIEPGEYEIRVYSLDFLDVPENQSTSVLQNFSVVATGDIDNGFLTFSTPQTCGCQNCHQLHPLHCACSNDTFGEFCHTHVKLMHGSKETFTVSPLELQLVRIESDKNIKSIGMSSNGIWAKIVHAFADTDCHLNIGQFPVSVGVGMYNHSTTNFDFNSTSICVALFNNFFKDTQFTIERDYVPPDNNGSGKHHKKKLSGGAIAGIVIACVAVVAIIITTTLCVIKKKRGSVGDF